MMTAAWIRSFCLACLILVPLSANAAMPLVHMRAFHFTGYWGGNPTGIKALPDAYFQYLANNNVNWLGISVAIFTGGMVDPTVKVIYTPATNQIPGAIYTFDDADLTTFIARVKQQGVKVYLTLAFQDSPEATQRDPSTLCHSAQYPVPRYLFGEMRFNPAVPVEACINPAYWWWNPSHSNYSTNVALFWNSYTQVAVKYATLAQHAGIEMISLGTETDRIFRTQNGSYPNNFRNELTQMVVAVRAAYSGVVTYDQVYDVQTSGNFYSASKPLFQDLGLDVVGVSAYFPLTSPPPTRVLSVSELESAWDTVFTNYLAPLQAANPGKPMVFLEFGYTDDVASPGNPTSNESTLFVSQDLSGNGVDDGRDQQNNIYQAFFNVNARYDDLVRGAFLWGNGMSNYDFDLTHRGFKLEGKPVELTVRGVYGAWKNDERLFSWAEAAYSAYFPVGANTQTASGYTYRYYPSTGNYLAFKNGRVVLHNGRDWNLLDVGAISLFLRLATAAGY
jgi:hypothetical protein